MNKKIILGVLLIFLVGFPFASAIPEWKDLTPEEQQRMIKVDQKFIPIYEKFIPSSTINPIRVNDPYASAGQPVMIEFTLANVGTEFPFNQIPLPSDAFVLVAAIDKEVGFRTSDGRELDVFSKMSGLQKFIFLTGLGLESSVNTVFATAIGQSCQFIDVFGILSKSVQEDAISRNNNKKPQVFMWDCLKLTDEETFKERVQEKCQDNSYTSACLSEINKQNANSIGNTKVVALVSDLPKGTCEQRRGKTTISYLAKNVIACGIGENGLRPGETVTIRFVAVVPSDTPVLQDEELAKSSEIYPDGFTYSASCLNSQYPKTCHSFYAAVFPMATDNLFKIFLDSSFDLFNVGGCAINKLFYGDGASFEACVEAKATSVDTVGDPIYEGQGTFYVLAPQLQGQVTLVLFGYFIVGLLSSSTLNRGG